MAFPKIGKFEFNAIPEDYEAGVICVTDYVGSEENSLIVEKQIIKTFTDDDSFLKPYEYFE